MKVHLGFYNLVTVATFAGNYKCKKVKIPRNCCSEHVTQVKIVFSIQKHHAEREAVVKVKKFVCGPKFKIYLQTTT